MNRIRRDVVLQQLRSGHLRMALTVLFMPEGYELSKTEVRQRYDEPCHICKKPKNQPGEKWCSYPHPIGREQPSLPIVKARAKERRKALEIIAQHEVENGMPPRFALGWKGNPKDYWWYMAAYEKAARRDAVEQMREERRGDFA